MGAGAALAEVERFLADEAEERIFSTGGQLYASVGGEPVVDLAVGVDAVDRPVTTDTLFAVYCAGKPTLALVLAGLVAEGEASFDDRLGDVAEVAIPDELATIRLDALLAHTAGLHQLDAHVYMALPARLHQPLALAARPPEHWRVGVDVAYSQVAAWDLLGLAVSGLTGEPVRDVVRRRVLEPAGVAGEVFVAGMTDAEFDAHRHRLGVNAYMTGLDLVPMLIERTRRFRCLASPAFGTTATARSLGRLYEAFGDAVAGRGPLAEAIGPGAAAPLVRRHSHGPDPVMDRTCGYGLGVMVGLRDHEFGGRVGDRAFGHSAFGGMTVGFCDPDHGLVVSYHATGRVDAGSALGYRRPALVDALYRALVDGG